MIELLNTAQVAKALGVSTKTLERWRNDENGPPFVRLPSPTKSHASIRYKRETLDDWIQAHTVRSNVMGFATAQRLWSINDHSQILGDAEQLLDASELEQAMDADLVMVLPLGEAVLEPWADLDALGRYVAELHEALDAFRGHTQAALDRARMNSETPDLPPGGGRRTL